MILKELTKASIIVWQCLWSFILLWTSIIQICLCASDCLKPAIGLSTFPPLFCVALCFIIQMSDLSLWTKTPQLWCDKSNGGSVRAVRGWRWSLCIGTTCQSSWAIASVRHSLLAESVPPKRKFVIVRCHDKVWLSLWYEDQRVWVCGAFGSLLCLPCLSH